MKYKKQLLAMFLFFTKSLGWQLTAHSNSCSWRSIDVSGCRFIFVTVYSITVSVVKSLHCRAVSSVQEYRNE